MPLQKRRMGPSRIHHRRSAWTRLAGSKPQNNPCPSCGAARLPHRVCMACGQYGGETIVEVAKTDEE
jgi:large subunit ribosomal protein L32